MAELNCNVTLDLGWRKRLRNIGCAVAWHCLITLLLVLPCRGEGIPTLCNQPIDPEKYRLMSEDGLLPLVPEMSDSDLARKLNLELDLPAIRGVKRALEAGDAQGLEHALGLYLDSRIAPREIKATGRPAENAAVADPWLQDSIEWNGMVCPLGEQINWWAGLAPGSNGEFFDFGPWLHPLLDAFAQSGDPRYARRVLEHLRSFYHNCRPPQHGEWSGRVHLGHWAPLQASGRLPAGYIESAYQTIGKFEEVSDADRVLILKVLWESTDFCYRLTGQRSVHNIEVAVLGGIIHQALLFPEFKDSLAWLRRAGERLSENMQDCILEDGGAFERTGYHFAFLRLYMEPFERLRAAGTPLPEAFGAGLRRMLHWSIWMLTPTLDYPLFGHGGLGPMQDVIERGSQLFPEDAELLHAASGGSQGTPPASLARALWHTGRLSMRSDWTRDALYLALSYNATPAGGSGFSGLDHLEALSFSLWAHGRPWMTNSGSTVNYGETEYGEWCSQTRSCNTVEVDGESSERIDNDGRLEAWASLPAGGGGFTYVAAASRGYERFGVEHKRAVLFLRPDYWVIHDVLRGTGEPHAYRWLGHFQSTRLSVNAATGTIATTETAGHRLWMIAARPDQLTIEEGSGPIVVREVDAANKPPLNPHRSIAPYVALRPRQAEATASFTVLLCPADAAETTPTVENLPVAGPHGPEADHAAIGIRVRRGQGEDLIAIAGTGALRSYGTEEEGFATDAECAYLRREGGRLMACGMTRGRSLAFAGEELLEAGPEISAVQVRREGELTFVTAEGRGGVSMVATEAGRVVCGERAVEAKAGERITFEIGQAGELTVEGLAVTNECESIGHAMGIPGVAEHPDALALTWRTAEPADACVEYRREGAENWTRSVNPEPLRDHLFALSGIDPLANYEIRVTSRDGAGRTGQAGLWRSAEAVVKPQP